MRLRDHLRLLLPERAQKRQAVVLLALSAAVAVLEAAGIGSIAPFIVLVQSPDLLRGSAAGRAFLELVSQSTPERTIVVAALLLVLLFAARAVVGLLHGYFTQRVTQGLYADLSSRLLAGYMAMPYDFHTSTNSAVLIRNVTTETRLIADHIVMQIITVASELLVLILIGVLLIYINPLIALVVAGLAGAALTGASFASRRLGRGLGKKRDEQHKEMIRIGQAALGGVNEVKVAGTRGYFVSEFRNAAEASAHATALVGFLATVPRLLLESLALLAILAAVFALSPSAGDSRSLPILVTFIAAGYRLMPSVNRIIMSTLMMQYLMPSYRNIAPSLLAALGFAKSHGGASSAPPEFESLGARDISFSYVGSESPVLAGVEFDLRQGEMIGLSGASGSGKSTLISILLGLISPGSGAVVLNGRPVIGEEDINALQSSVAYVAQNIFVADDTFERNVALGVPDDEIDRNALARAVRLAQLEDVVAELPQGLATKVGEAGSRLSGGQAQRLGIARALYRGRPILIFDEATNALDAATEERIMEGLAFERARTRLSTIVITHNPAVLDRCDRVYAMTDGATRPL
jgi:ABC-type multidrug transport system fused ATPase/permease subunit